MKTHDYEVKTHNWRTHMEGLYPYPGADKAVSKAVHQKTTKKGYLLNNGKFVLVDYVRYKPRGRTYPHLYVLSGGLDVLIAQRSKLKQVTKRNKELIEKYNELSECITNLNNFRSTFLDDMECVR